MKRAPELRTLSEDHHHGLVHAHCLQKSAGGDEEHPLGATAAAFLAFWQNKTSAHLPSHEP